MKLNLSFCLSGCVALHNAKSINSTTFYHIIAHLLDKQLQVDQGKGSEFVPF